MSRAVDDEIAAQLQKHVTEKVYLEIAEALCPDPPRLLEIELLGKSHSLPSGSSFLADNHFIAIPKLKVIQAFVYARQILFQYLKSCPLRYPDLFKATAVILLMDPEHLTAANWRKRYIKYCKTEPKQDYENVLRRELFFIDSYLTSRLHRHTKSPTLWSHRRWLLEQFKEMKLERSCERDLESVVLVAAERHPRNYYAWLHMRWLIQDFDGGGKAFNQALILSVVKSWCLKHPADTSGFSFLLFYLDFLGKAHRSPDSRAQIDAINSVYGEVLERTSSFKWTHESVWVFLRTLAGGGRIATHKASLLETADSITRASTDPKVLSTLQASIDWLINYDQTSSSRTVREAQMATTSLSQLP